MSRELLFEIGVEEMPASYIVPALEQLERGARTGLTDLHLDGERIASFGSPRRLTLVVHGLAERQPDRDEEVTGPNAKAAYDAEGKPTKALLGFCQGRGVDPAAVRRVNTPKGEYIAATVHHVGKPAAKVMPALLASIAARIQFPKSMRWLADDTRFARPVRWLLALLDGDVLPVRAFGIEAGRDTFGHRFLAPQRFAVAHARDYAGALERAHVLVDHRVRRARIQQQIDQLAASLGGMVHADPELVEINTFLAEQPTAFAGAFDPRYVSLPSEVIVTALREHQRFFAIAAKQAPDTLMPHFIAVRDGNDRGLDVVRRGNEAVLTARLEDAEFYWHTDLKRTLDQQIEALSGVVWMEGLGSLREKAERLQSLAAWLASRLSPADEGTARRAALLCKTDLTSEMIGSGKEYTALEGIIGSYYAKQAGEPDTVCRAIYEHYRPAGSGEALPDSEAGAILSIADKLDHVAGAFVAGKIPTGSEDPYGVRRAGNGVIRVLMDQERSLDLYAASMESTRILFGNDPNLPHAEIMKKLGEFWRGRVETALDEHGIAYDARDAALEARPAAADGKTRPGWTDPGDALLRASVLAGFRGDRRFEPLAVLFKRVSNIVRAATEPIPAALDRSALEESAEQELAAALDRARTKSDPLWARRAYAEILPALLEMEHVIHDFFDRVLVNTDDARLRLNRLRLLSEVRALFLRGWDVSRVVVEGEKAQAELAPATTRG